MQSPCAVRVRPLRHTSAVRIWSAARQKTGRHGPTGRPRSARSGGGRTGFAVPARRPHDVSPLCVTTATMPKMSPRASLGCLSGASLSEAALWGGSLGCPSGAALRRLSGAALSGASLGRLSGAALSGVSLGRLSRAALGRLARAALSSERLARG